MNKKGILIVGCRGFIGQHLVEYYIKKGWQVTGCDIIEYSTNLFSYHKVSVTSIDLETLFTGHNFSVCINASGNGNVGYSIDHPLSDFEANTYTVARILDCIRKHQPGCKYLHISSAAVYGNPAKLPVLESDPVQPVSPYGFNKLMSEQLCSCYHKLYNIGIAIVRPFSVFGNGLRKQLLWDICNKLSGNDLIELFGTGDESRDFIHINDMAELINMIIQHSHFQLDIYNAASGCETSIRQIAALSCEHFDSSKKIIFNGQRKAGDPVNWQADISKIIALGYTNTVSLSDGVSEYIHWYKKNGSEQ